MSKSILLDLVETNEGRLAAYGELGIPGKLLRRLLQPPGPAPVAPQKMHILSSCKAEDHYGYKGKNAVRLAGEPRRKVTRRRGDWVWIRSRFTRLVCFLSISKTWVIWISKRKWSCLFSKEKYLTGGMWYMNCSWCCGAMADSLLHWPGQLPPTLSLPG